MRGRAVRRAEGGSQALTWWGTSSSMHSSEMATASAAPDTSSGSCKRAHSCKHAERPLCCCLDWRGGRQRRRESAAATARRAEAGRVGQGASARPGTADQFQRPVALSAASPSLTHLRRVERGAQVLHAALQRRRVPYAALPRLDRLARQRRRCARTRTRTPRRRDHAPAARAARAANSHTGANGEVEPAVGRGAFLPFIDGASSSGGAHL